MKTANFGFSAFLTLCLCVIPQYLFAQKTERLSINEAGVEGNGSTAFVPDITPDMNFVAFASYASNLIADDTNYKTDIFVRNQQSGAIERINVSDGGIVANDDRRHSLSISADGRFVAFDSWASNLVPNDHNNLIDVFVRDRLNRTTTRINVNSQGGEVYRGHSERPKISADGRFVAFSSGSPDIVPDDTLGIDSFDVFVRDLENETTERVSVDSAGNEANHWSWGQDISADGRFVVFYSHASNLVPDDTNGRPDIFLHDRHTGVTERVSLSNTGRQARLGAHHPAISDDGRFVVFTSSSEGLAPGDRNGYSIADVFVRDLVAKTTEIVSVDSNGESVTYGASDHGAISADGRFVVFQSWSHQLVPDDTNGRADLFVHDRFTGNTKRVNVDTYGNQANAETRAAVISANGRHIVFPSLADNLVPNDTNGSYDLFSHDHFGPLDLIDQLIFAIDLLNLKAGISNSLDSKIVSAMKALDDLNENNNAGACGSLEALINALEAQSGKEIGVQDAMNLVDDVYEILELLECF